MRKLHFLLLFIACICSCREHYDPNVKSLDRSFLVVEANLDPGPDSTYIRLTRTSKLDNSRNIIAENGAQVTVEGEDNSTRAMVHTGNGYYVSNNLNLTIGTGYRVRIRTSNGNEYLSDYVKARLTPPIDSITYEEKDNLLWIYANTHDPSNNSRYYRWTFDETWEINSYYFAEYIWDNNINDVRRRIIPDEMVFFCWKYDASRTFMLANSTRLQNDVISKALVHTITLDDEKVSVRYSMLLRQYALDKGAYDFFELMKKNTEEIGNIFAPQPFELAGNIKCISDPTEYTLGYITASTVQKQRQFIRVNRPGFRELCPSRMVTNNPDTLRFYFKTGDYFPYTFDFGENKYLAAKPPCVDCRWRGGNLNRPSYW